MLGGNCLLGCKDLPSEMFSWMVPSTDGQSRPSPTHEVTEHIQLGAGAKQSPCRDRVPVYI